MNTSIEIKNKHILASVAEGTEVFVLTELLRKDGGDILYIALDDLRMARLESSLKFFAPEIDVLSFPAWDCIPYDRVSPNNNVVGRRIKTLGLLADSNANQGRVVITTVNAVIQRVLPRNLVRKAVFIARPGDNIKRDELSEFLVHNGYINTGTASEPGEFALRGSIVDIVPPGGSSDDERGFRLDFFGSELETIRSFDPLTQISGGKVEQLELVPASEVLLDENSIKNFRSKYRELFGAVLKEDPLYEAVSEGRKYAGMEHWLPLFYAHLESLFDYMPGSVVIFGHLAEEAIGERKELILDSYTTRKQAMDMVSGEVTYKPAPPEMLYFTENDWNTVIGKRKICGFEPFNLPQAENVTSLGYRQSRNFHAESAKTQKTAFEMVREELNTPENGKLLPLIACVSEGSRSRMELMLKEYDIPYIIMDSWSGRKRLRRKQGGDTPHIGLIILNIDNGFHTNDILLITEQDILGEKIYRPKARKKRRSDKFLAEASSLDEGELVTHKEHGIGRFEGLETLDVQGILHDFLKLIYHGDDRLYVPVENLDLVTRYGGSEETAQLDKLGGLSWQKRTAAVKKRIKLAAEELLAIAARRALNKSPEFDPDGGAYAEFCTRFPYTETEDQQNSINAVIEDLRSGKPMDRLVCGDVGFGKTEVALRAAYIVSHPAEGEQKGQVALVAPTTLLARQHYQTFRQRFADMGINVRHLSRLVPDREVKEVKAGIESGDVDIVIGTHALLAKDIKFNNLALVIVDEEQRFGVAQKERLKKLRTNTHVLTLTATPIPRTLQLAMSGVRELSLIATPPIDRLAVRTYVMPYDPMVIRDAILREHYRGGRTFYVCPRIKDIEQVEKQLHELVPEVKLVVAHGQMPPSQLDEIMNAFYDGKYDILLATTIIESGIDIPEANTMIIHRADMYGLAQLYQLRGRVGRSKVRAYAYLTLPPRRIPTKQALQRLEVMQKLDSLGAGFSLASYDMDIRGFGNLVGDEQSGHIREVGIELYQDMLREAIERAKAEGEGVEASAASDEFTPQINLGTSVLIPETYIQDLGLRMSLYRRIAGLESDEEVEAVAVELVDRFGELPQEVENLLSVVKLKQICRKAGIEKLDIGAKGAVITFHNNNFSNPDALINFVMQNSEKFKLRGDHKLSLHGSQDWQKSTESRISQTRNSLQDIVSLVA